MDRYDEEIGRGRRRSEDNSGSSRESSTERPIPRRIASPAASEDGDATMQAVADDDTPPPASRPLIRQALGFSSDQPPQSINTYEASPDTLPKRPVFLPGQEVPIPPQPIVEKPSKKKPKRPRRTDVYSGQTTRFRIQAYDATPSANPPLDRGSGPYASMYRGTVSQSNINDGQSFPVQSNAGPSSSTTPSNTADSLLTKVKASAPRRATSNRSSAAQKTSAQPTKPTHSIATSNSNKQSSSSSYQHYQAPVSATASSSSNYHGSTHSTDDTRRSSPDRDYHSGLRESQYPPTQAAAYTSEAQKRSKPPLRMVTLLIQDMRSGTIDRQLAEVRVPLKHGDVPEDGFWADAKDITYQLQSGPCRIDGPARAYTLRGKYRQFILRVSANNVDDFMSANVAVQPDRTLDVVVEMLPPLGEAPPPPKIPPDLLNPSYESNDQNPPQDRRKRANSASNDDYDTGGPCHKSHSAPNKTPRHSYYINSRSPSHASSHFSGQHSLGSPDRSRSITYDLSQAEYTIQGPTSMSPQRPPRTASPVNNTSQAARNLDDSSDDSMSPIADDGKFIAAVDLKLQEDSKWTDFFRLKASNKISNIIKEYEFVRDKCKALRGTLVSPFAQRIEDHHIIRALQIDDKDYIQNCNRTLDLYLLYGEHGRHYEDPEVMELINDTTPPKSGSNLYKRILHLLQKVDEQWDKRQQHPRPLAASRTDSNHSDPLRQESRGTKGMFV